MNNNIAEINRCNQRGSRMLSIIDLIERNTIGLQTASYLAYRIHNGASFITGAVPGGAGKTTVMGALLNLIPCGMEIIPCEDTPEVDRVKQSKDSVCALAHEISPGPYYCYVWGDLLRRFFALGRYGHLLAANLHADNLPQAEEQICGENTVPESDFRSIDFFVFLSASGGFMDKTVTVSHIMRFDCESGVYKELTPDFTEH